LTFIAFIMKRVSPNTGAAADSPSSFHHQTEDLEYPMFVMAIPTFMNLSSLPDHQEMLQSRDLLLYDPDTMRGLTMFISHQWTSYGHADVTGVQLKTLQTVFARLASGDIARVEGDWKYQLTAGGNKIVRREEWQARLPKMFVWIDFSCIPQMDIPLTAELVLDYVPKMTKKPTLLRSLSAKFAASFTLQRRESMKEVTPRREYGREAGTAGRSESGQVTTGSSFESTARAVTTTTTIPAVTAFDDERDQEETKADASDSDDTASADKNVPHTSDHRHASAETEGWKKFNKLMLDKAVTCIPAYIERCSLIIALVPPCIHADRDGEICDQGSWRGRGWCRVSRTLIAMSLFAPFSRPRSTHTCSTDV
jgi:hypothetical protein